MHRALLTLALVALLDGSTAADIRGTVINPRLAGLPDVLVTPAFELAKKKLEQVEGKLVRFDENWCDRCEGPGDLVEEFDEPVVLFQGTYSEKCFPCGYARVVEWALKKNATAMLWFSHYTPGHEARVVHNFAEAEKVKSKFPLLEIASADCEVILKALETGAELTADVKDSPNEWLLFYDSGWLITRMIVAVLSFLVVLFGAVRLYKFAPSYFRNGQHKAAVVILTMEIFTNLIRGTYAALDPFWCNLIFPYGISRILITITLPIELATTVVILLAWNDILTSSYVNKAFLSKRSKPLFIGIACVLIGTDILFSFLAAFEGLVLLSSLAGALLALFSIVIAAFIFVVGGRLIKQLKLFSTNGSNSSASMGTDSTDNAEPTSFASSNAHVTDVSNFAHPGGFEEGATSREQDFVDDLHDGESFKASVQKSKSSKTMMRSKSGKNIKKKEVRADVRNMTRKIIALACALIFTALMVGLSSQEFVVFNPTPRAIGFGLLYAALSLQSFLKIVFFIVPRK